MAICCHILSRLVVVVLVDKDSSAGNGAQSRVSTYCEGSDSSIANVATSTGGGAGGNQIGTRYVGGDGGSGGGGYQFTSGGRSGISGSTTGNAGGLLEVVVVEQAVVSLQSRLGWWRWTWWKMNLVVLELVTLVVVVEVVTIILTPAVEAYGSNISINKHNYNGCYAKIDSNSIVTDGGAGNYIT